MGMLPYRFQRMDAKHFWGGKVHMLQEEEWDRAFAINVKSMFPEEGVNHFV